MKRVIIVLLGTLDFIAISCLFLVYGPIDYFRNLWVTSAMTTMNHQYLAYIFFNQDRIEEIMSNNYVISTGEETNEEEINIEKIDEKNKDAIVYENEYEEAVLKKDEGNELYKVIKVSGDGYVGHLLVIYDASKIKLTQVSNLRGGKVLSDLVEENDAIAGINASGFSYSEYDGYSPTGSVIIDGKIINDNGRSSYFGGGIVGFTNNNVLVLTQKSAEEAINMGIRDAVYFGPFLIVNGVASEFSGNGGYGVAPRTAIGQRKDGIVLFLVIDGRRVGHSIGVDMVELTNIMQKYGAYNAVNLDGGGSSSMYVNGETLSIAGGYGYEGERYLPNAWILKK